MAKYDTNKHTEGTEEYRSIKDVLQPHGNGYPNNVRNTKTVKIRGTGAATKGTKCSTKLG